jgi:hypothetical protein
MTLKEKLKKILKGVYYYMQGDQFWEFWLPALFIDSNEKLPNSWLGD